jgi:homoserine acetyltransferase
MPDAATFATPEPFLWRRAMTWQQTSHEAAFTAKDFLFADGRRTDLRLAYRTLGELAPDKGNAILLLHGTVGSGLQFLRIPVIVNVQSVRS